MDLSRQHIVLSLRRAGMSELAEDAEEELPDLVPEQLADQFCADHGLTKSMLIDRMGGSP